MYICSTYLLQMELPADIGLCRDYKEEAYSDEYVIF